MTQNVFVSQYQHAAALYRCFNEDSLRYGDIIDGMDVKHRHTYNMHSRIITQKWSPTEVTYGATSTALAPTALPCVLTQCHGATSTLLVLTALPRVLAYGTSSGSTPLAPTVQSRVLAYGGTSAVLGLAPTAAPNVHVLTYGAAPTPLNQAWS